ncbi:ABC transporter ATP-binding protein [Candidatus Chordibacter forsetii]|uniref:ABC transporter ATP-binding protein n=1 Tax=Candidatus Chordibacter forsetii TaxID=3381758 RepID=UPI002326C3F4|nr:ABC transporter ATP-binding protein [Opitutales bacterium]MDB3957674.1 ABC transporter ATP-binding protein [Opitutales bacterium]
MHPILKVHQACKSFQQGNHKVKVLEHLDLEVIQGEKVAILGPSGCGKSTLLSLLAGLDNPDSGTVEIDGTDLAKINEDQLSQTRSEKLGIVFQQYHLMRNLTAVENVGLPLEILETTDFSDRARTALKEVGLDHRATHFPSEMSGGECQRVAIARALVTRPALILADEPSGNLDQKTGDEVMDILFNLCREHTTSLVLVTHNRELADRCDRSLLLNEGTLEDLTK